MGVCKKLLKNGFFFTKSTNVLYNVCSCVLPLFLQPAVNDLDEDANSYILYKEINSLSYPSNF